MKILYFLERFLPLVFWVLLIFGFDSPSIATATLLGALIHECGHLIAIRISTGRTSSLPKGSLTGFRIKQQSISYRDELISALGGPFINVLVFLICFSVAKCRTLSEYISDFGIINLMSAISNLLPIEGYDGYRILSCILSLTVTNPLKATKILELFSFLFSAFASFLGLYLMLKADAGYWIFAVFFSTLISSVIKRQNNTIFKNQ